MTRLILALLANALSQDVVDPSGKVDLPHGSAVPMPSTSTPSPTEAEFVHEDKSDAEFDDVTWTSSLLLIGFVLTSMAILCLVNCFDKHIRKESWAFLSTTVSIFSAASFDFAVYRLLEIAIDKFGGHEHDSEHDMAKQCGIVIALSIWCLLVFLILHILLLKFTEQHCLFAISNLGSHIYAFASILVFGTMQRWDMQKWDFSLQGTPWVWSIPFLALVVMVLLFTGWRSQRFEKGEQLKTAIEVQIDAIAISVAFLLVQALCYTMSLPDQDQPQKTHEERFMPITNGSPGKHVRSAWLQLFLWALGFLTFSSIWSACLNSKHKCCHEFTEFIEKLVSVMGSWCLQRGGMLVWFHTVWDRMNWYLKKLCESEHQHLDCKDTIHFDRIQAAHRAQILNAYAMSIFAILVVIGIDKIADRFEDDDCYYHGAAFGLRSVMSGLGLLVGICWDKAFETAYETILEERSIDNLMSEGDSLYWLIHYKFPFTAKLCTVGVGVAMSVLVAYAWYWFIAPHAMKETEEHEDEIELHRKTFDKLATPKSIPLSTSESSSE